MANNPAVISMTAPAEIPPRVIESSPTNNSLFIGLAHFAHIRQSTYGNAFLRRGDRSVVVGPAELESTAFVDFGVELHVGIGGNRGLKIDGQHRLSVELTRKLIDDLARDCLAVLILALPRF